MPEDIWETCYEVLVPALALERTDFANPQEEPELKRRTQRAFEQIAGTSVPKVLTNERLYAHLRRLRRQHQNLIFKRRLALKRLEDDKGMFPAAWSRLEGRGSGAERWLGDPFEAVMAPEALPGYRGARR